MPKIRLTKGELKRQRDDLKRFMRFLPTLELKKRQLIQEVNLVNKQISSLKKESENHLEEISKWIDVFADEVDLENYFKTKEIQLEEGNVSGVNIPVLKNVLFEETDYDFITTAVWIDAGIESCKKQVLFNAKIKVYKQQIDILKEELRITIQRIKLFEEVKIPKARESIRIIQIFLADQQTAEVVRGKIAKAKLKN